MYYVKNNRVGFLKLYESVRKPNGRTEKGKPIYSPTRAQVQAWLSKQIPALDYKPVESSKESRPILVSKIGDLVKKQTISKRSNRTLDFNGHDSELYYIYYFGVVPIYPIYYIYI